MKYQIMLGIFFTLLNNRKATATELAKKFSCSVRSIYRYVDEMTVAGVPIDLMQGARGGIRISDSYKLPKGLMTREEYDKTLDALGVPRTVARQRARFRHRQADFRPKR